MAAALNWWVAENEAMAGFQFGSGHFYVLIFLIYIRYMINIRYMTSQFESKWVRDCIPTGFFRKNHKIFR